MTSVQMQIKRRNKNLEFETWQKKRWLSHDTKLIGKILIFLACPLIVCGLYFSGMSSMNAALPHLCRFCVVVCTVLSFKYAPIEVQNWMIFGIFLAANIWQVVKLGSERTDEDLDTIGTQKILSGPLCTRLLEQYLLFDHADSLGLLPAVSLMPIFSIFRHLFEPWQKSMIHLVIGFRVCLTMKYSLSNHSGDMTITLLTHTLITTIPIIADNISRERIEQELYVVQSGQQQANEGTSETEHHLRNFHGYLGKLAERICCPKVTEKIVEVLLELKQLFIGTTFIFSPRSPHPPRNVCGNLKSLRSSKDDWRTGSDLSDFVTLPDRRRMVWSDPDLHLKGNYYVTKHDFANVTKKIVSGEPPPARGWNRKIVLMASLALLIFSVASLPFSHNVLPVADKAALRWKYVTADDRTFVFLNPWKTRRETRHAERRRQPQILLDQKHPNRQSISYGVTRNARAHFKWFPSSYTGMFRQADHCIVQIPNATHSRSQGMKADRPSMMVECFNGSPDDVATLATWKIDASTLTTEKTGSFLKAMHNDESLHNDKEATTMEKITSHFSSGGASSMLLAFSQVNQSGGRIPAVEASFPSALIFKPVEGIDDIIYGFEKYTSRTTNGPLGLKLYDVLATAGPYQTDGSEQEMIEIGEFMIDSSFVGT